jgi:outer membrane protein assembly factor BamE
MRLLSRIDRTTALTGALLLALAAGLPGCASKNPLIDETVASTANKPADASVRTGTDGVKTVEPSTFQRAINFLRPYRVDVQQGNFVSREMVAQLKEGMQRKEGVTREQVRFALGTPLLTDIFHSDRWDYVFRLKKRNGEIISSRVTAYFKGDLLANIEGDQLPTEKEYLAYIAGNPPAAPAAPAANETKSEPVKASPEAK